MYRLYYLFAAIIALLTFIIILPVLILVGSIYLVVLLGVIIA
jgi:hypothetical protein